MAGPGDPEILGDGTLEQRVEDIEHAPERTNTFVPQRRYLTAAERARRNLNAKLANPLAGYSHEELRSQGIKFALKSYGR